ncbi:hypothetical protein PROFUN_00183 [Planoprotostelium fungivorum]|uniref:Uncharacterized protein n=1 Tax=Planoprotostelium fungivorum TaxID=1890364 RepID=A0A2P6P0V9_9EUKA|nr:hypothetical protein PROFUN_00183 [Planoprotostelium fungivorum]
MTTLYTWGLGKEGQLGNGKMESEPLPYRILKVVCDGKVVKAPTNISAISAGQLNSAFVTGSIITNQVNDSRFADDGRVFTCGSNRYGRSGRTATEDRSLLFTQVEFFNNPIRITSISCGTTHTATLSSDGHVYTWGSSNKDRAPELGHGIEAKSCGEPKRMSGQLLMERAKRVTCGSHLTAVITEEEKLYVAGKFMDLPSNFLPNLVGAPGGAAVSAVACGIHYMLMVAGDIVYCWGHSSALGLGSRKRADRWTEIPELTQKDVVDISCSTSEHHPHSAAVTRDGQLYMWGEGYKGKLGTGDETDRFIPVQLEPLTKSVSCGGIHSASLSIDGAVMTWGCGSDGRLGHPRYLEGKYRYLYRELSPLAMKNLEKIRGVDVQKWRFRSPRHCHSLVRDKEPFQTTSLSTENMQANLFFCLFVIFSFALSANVATLHGPKSYDVSCKMRMGRDCFLPCRAKYAIGNITVSDENVEWRKLNERNAKCDLKSTAPKVAGGCTATCFKQESS